MAMLQRPRVAHDGERPLSRELHLVVHLFRKVIAVAERQIHLGDTPVGLRDGHLDVIDKGAEKRPFTVCALQKLKVAERLASTSQAVPSRQVDARLRPRENPRNGAQVVERLRPQAALGRTRADGQQAHLGKRRHDGEPRRKVVGVQQVEVPVM